jgi:kinesin family member C2/C3
LQLGLFLKKILKGDIGCLSRREFVEAISLYLNQRSSLASNDFSKFCSCGGMRDNVRQNVNYSAKYAEVINTQQKQLEV